MSSVIRKIPRCLATAATPRPCWLVALAVAAACGGRSALHAAQGAGGASPGQLGGSGGSGGATAYGATSGTGGATGSGGTSAVTTVYCLPPFGAVVAQTNHEDPAGCAGRCSASSPSTAECIADSCRVTLADCQDSPVGIAVDATHVYWTTSGAQANAWQGTVMKVPRAGGMPITLATGQPYPGDIAVDATSVYWIVGMNSYERAVMKLPLAGGTGTPLLSGQRSLGSSIAVDGTSAYFTDIGEGGNVGQGSVLKVAKDGGPPTTLAAAQWYPYAIALDADNLYWTNRGDGTNPMGGSVMKVSLRGGTPVTLASGQTYPSAIAVDADNVYWLNGVAYAGTSADIMKMPLQGGTPVTLASGHDTPVGIAVDSRNLYWTTPGANSVMQLPLAGGTPTIFAIGKYPLSIIANADWVYWLDSPVVFF